MNQYTPLHVHSHNSLLDGLSKTSKIVDRIKTINSDTCAITDHGVLSGNIDFYKDMTKAGKKPILGCELYICDESANKQEKENRALTHLVVLAKSKAGWKNLIKLVSESNKVEHFYHRPRLSLAELTPFTKDLIAFSGHLGSHLANDLFIDYKLAYRAKTLEDARSILHKDYKDRATKRVGDFQSLFGKENFFLEVQLFDKENLPAQQVVTEILREIGTSLGLACIATPDAHYANKDDAYDQRVLLCSSLQTTFPQVEYQLQHNEDVSLGAFFKSNRYYIPSYEEMIQFGHTDAELQATNEIANAIEKYDVLSKPVLPEFATPSGPDEYLRQLCGDGWSHKIQNKIPKSEQSTYAERVKYELSVLQGAGLSSYFLTLNDICGFIKSKGWLPNVGRGSAAGCLVSYLINITQVDPIKYGLIFERFYNAGRNTKDRVSMPDIDLDVPADKRDEVIDYIKTKFGENKVGQIANFQTIKGRGSIKEVLRAYGSTPYEVMNKITEHIPDEQKIIGDLQAMKEEGEEPSIIRWALENTPEHFTEWVQLDSDGNLVGPMSKRFEQAIRLEGVRKSQGRHASGLVVSAEPLGEVCPLVLDKEKKNSVVGYEMNNAEDVGLVKFDILGLSLQTKLQGIINILKTGDI